MNERQQITIGFEPAPVNGRYTMLVNGQPRYMGLTFDRREIGERVAWLERSCDVSYDESRGLPASKNKLTSRSISLDSRRGKSDTGHGLNENHKHKGDTTMAKANENGTATKRARVAKQNLAQMIESGAVKAGQKISAFYRNHEVAGTIRQDGTVRLTSKTLKDVDGQVYGSLSDAGRAVCTAAGNEKASINGFTFFGVKNAEGKTVAIDTLRQ